MAWKPSELKLNPFQVQTQDLVNKVKCQQQVRKLTISTKLQIGSSSQFSLPEGWTVETRPRPTKPTHVDKYYYEPHTRKQFRSLLSVQRYLAGETVQRPAKRMKSKKTHNTNLTESGAGQESSSFRAVDNFLLEGSTSSKSRVKSGAGEKKAGGTRNKGKSVYRPSSAAKEEITPMSWKHSFPSGSRTNPEKTSGASVHNLTSPPPTKIKWVLSGRDNWNPTVHGSPVTESERLKWSVLSSRRNGVNGPNN